MPDEKYIAVPTESNMPLATEQEQHFTASIPIVQEELQVGKRTIDTATVQISKRVFETAEEVNIPLTTEQYSVNRIPINQVVVTPPPAIRHEGDTTIFSIIKEVLVVEKRYEIMEEVHVTKQRTETVETQHITLRKEEVTIERTPVNEAGV